MAPRALDRSGLKKRPVEQDSAGWGSRRRGASTQGGTPPSGLSVRQTFPETGLHPECCALIFGFAVSRPDPASRRRRQGGCCARRPRSPARRPSVARRGRGRPQGPHRSGQFSPFPVTQEGEASAVMVGDTSSRGGGGREDGGDQRAPPRAGSWGRRRAARVCPAPTASPGLRRYFHRHFGGQHWRRRAAVPPIRVQSRAEPRPGVSGFAT